MRIYNNKIYQNFQPIKYIKNYGKAIFATAAFGILTAECTKFHEEIKPEQQYPQGDINVQIDTTDTKIYHFNMLV